MGLFCWKKCQKARAKRQEEKTKRVIARQDAKVAKVDARQAAKTVGFLQGFDTSFNSNFAQPLGHIGSNLASGLTGGSLGALLGGGSNTGGASGSISFGKNQWIPIIIAGAVALVFVFRDVILGNGSTRKRRK